ncbi:hypothetical protein JL108_05260 [Aeromicrobium sp. YIM 150415]|uniref:RNA polymerase subunit sigma-70 n=1 Tax=Aeromicrobium piscarium TaxID=2590901 RepID=A0A554SGP2_9ACTN|nr:MULTISPECIES: SatD family protein [Aeromicrobium]MBM9462849.1 hypothetical protein [Aeromicrobium sp. YIM 150415]TSD65508.1 hypothetical protein FNM00_03520 [Aeromicrobium piscarium]
MAVAIIGDLVESRAWDDRGALHRAVLQACAVTAELVPGAVQALEPTIGDELQAVYPDVATALDAAMILRLSLPHPADCRAGIGVGDVEIVGPGAYGLIQDGSAWWAAREALEDVERQERRIRGLRTRVWAADGYEKGEFVNAYAVCRDHIVSDLDERQRRLVLGLLRGHTQEELAEQEGITQSAVSQSLRRSGALALKDAWGRP